MLTTSVPKLGYVVAAIIMIGCSACSDSDHSNEKLNVTSREEDFGNQPKLAPTHSFDSLPPALAVCYSKCGSLIVTSHTDNHIRVWDAKTGKSLRTVKVNHTIYTVAISPDKTKLALAWRDELPGCNRLGIIDLADEKLVRVIRAAMPFQTIAFAPGSWSIARADNWGNVIITNLKTGKETFRVKDGWCLWSTMAFSPSGRWIALGTESGKIHFLNVKKKKVLKLFDKHSVTVSALEFVEDEATFFSVDGYGNVYHTSFPQLKVINKYKIDRHYQPISLYIMKKREHYFACLNLLIGLRVVDLKTGQPILQKE